MSGEGDLQTGEKRRTGAARRGLRARGTRARRLRGSRGAAALCAGLLLAGCEPGPERESVPAPAPAAAAPAQPAAAAAGPFDGERAFADLRDLVAIGPRASGTPGIEAARELIRTRMRAAGWRVEDHPVTAVTPTGERVPLVNLICTLPGAQETSLLLGAHYDTKRFDQRFVGANDGASGTAVLLELARWLGRGPRPPLTLRMLFFDGEEAFGASITNSDGLYGSKALAEKFQQEGELARARALILVDMVGDRDLTLGVDLNSAANLRELQLKHGAGIVDREHSFPLIDDHIPFLERGLDQVLALIDFQFGARESPGPLWHTPGDDLSAVSAQSLNSVGNLVVRIVEELGGAPVPTAAAPEASLGVHPAAQNAARSAS